MTGSVFQNGYLNCLTKCPTSNLSFEMTVRDSNNHFKKRTRRYFNVNILVVVAQGYFSTSNLFFHILCIYYAILSGDTFYVKNILLVQECNDSSEQSRCCEIF